MNFQISLSLPLKVLFLISSRLFCAVRQPPVGAAGQIVLSHESDDSLQTEVKAQGSAPSVQTFDWQVSLPSQNSPLGHGVPSGWNRSVGQALVAPSQLSATSQTPVAARHTL